MELRSSSSDSPASGSSDSSPTSDASADASLAPTQATAIPGSPIRLPISQRPRLSSLLSSFRLNSAALVVAGALLTPQLAHAGGGKLAAGTTRDDKLFLDEPESLVEVRNGDDGYTIRVSGRLAGYGNTADQLFVELKQKGKLLEKIPCEHSLYSTAEKWSNFLCTGTKAQKTPGPIEAALVYRDDVTEQSYLVRTFTTTVHASAFNGGAKWVATPDDLLGAAYVRHIAPDLGNHRVPALEFQYWTSGEVRDPRFRCTVDGRKLPDFETSSFSTPLDTTDELELDQTVNGARQTIKWVRHHTRLKKVIPGDKAIAAEAMLLEVEDLEQHYAPLADLAGAWVCDVRAAGATGRRFTFTVTAEGKVARHAAQDAEGATPSWRNVSLIAAGFPSGGDVEQPFDARVRPEAMQKSMGFGLPWPAGTEELRAGFPAKKKGTVEPRRGK